VAVRGGWHCAQWRALKGRETSNTTPPYVGWPA
jgi:hypothetical protein